MNIYRFALVWLVLLSAACCTVAAPAPLLRTNHHRSPPWPVGRTLHCPRTVLTTHFYAGGRCHVSDGRRHWEGRWWLDEYTPSNRVIIAYGYDYDYDRPVQHWYWREDK